MGASRDKSLLLASLLLLGATLACVGATAPVQQGSLSNDEVLKHWQQVKVLDASAGVFMHEDFLSAEECEHLIKLAEPRLERSGVVATSTNGTGEAVTHAVRTSSGAAFMRGEDDVIKAIEERIARWSLLPVSHQENMQVLRYEPGQQYRPHWDFFQDNTTVRNGGNRHTTVVVYLNDVEDGGETVFPLLPAAAMAAATSAAAAMPAAEAGAAPAAQAECAAKGLSVKPKRGTALLWHNLTPEGQLEPRSLHAGCPVVSGVKYALAKWIRAGPYATMEDRMLALAAARQHATQQQHAAAGLLQVANLLAVAAAR